MLEPRREARPVAASFRQRRERLECRVQEPAEPDALPLAVLADPVHAVVPVAGADQRQAVRADGETPVEPTRAVLEQRRTLFREHRLEVGVVLAGAERLAFEERHGLVQHRAVAGRLYIVCDGVGEPHPVVGNARTHALPRRRHPPVLKVALDELPGRGAQEMRARERRSRQRERHPVLELVAETVGAARLVERRACPHAAGERLVEQPAIQHEVHRPVRRSHLHRAQHIVPVVHDAAQDRIEIGGPVASDQGLRIGRGRRLAEEEDELHRLPRLELDRRLQGAAGVEAGAHPLRERRVPGQRGGMVERAVTPQKLSPVAGPCDLPSAEVRERDVGTERDAPRVAREHRARFRIDLRHDRGRRRAARRAEHPLDIGGDREPPGSPRRVPDRQPGELDRVLERHVLDGDRARCRARRARTGCIPGRAWRRRAQPRCGSAGRSAPTARPSPRRAHRAPRPAGRRPDRSTRA